MKRIVHIVLLLNLTLLVGCAGGPEKIETVFYPMPPETPRIQFLTSISKEKDLGRSSRFREYLIGKEDAGKRLARPYALAHEKAKIYIADKTAKKILIVDLVNRSFDYIRDVKGGALQDPSGIYITDDGYKYVADAGRGQIVVFNQRNEFHQAYGAEKQFRPTDVVVYGKRIYVCDIRDNEIEVLDKDTGEVITKIGGIGRQEGAFHKPTHVAIDAAGNLYVTDAFNFRVQKFDKDGKFIKVIGYQGSHPGAFARPKGIAVDRAGRLYAVDAAFELVQVFDIDTAEPLLPFGKYGPAPGSTYLPAGIHLDYDNVEFFNKYVDGDFRVKYLIYVGNLLGDNKLNVYGFGDWIGPPLKGIATPGKAQLGEPAATRKR
jgi:DNA-binding beta-propeller fold protein YncE